MFANRAMAVARLTCLNMSIPLSGTASTPGRLDHSAPVHPSPVRKTKRTTEFISGCVDELPVKSPVVVAEHLPYILNLHSIHLCVGKDLLLRQIPTLALGTTRVVVPTGSRPTGILILLSMIDTLAYSFTTHAVPGVGGGTGICPLIGLGPQRMDPVHVPLAKDRRCAPTTT